MALVLSGSIDISGSMTATTILISSPGAAGMVSSSAQITELAPLMAYTASLKGQAIVSSSTQIQNYDLFALNSNLYNGTGSIKGEIAGIEAYTASLKGAIEVSGQNVNVLGTITAQQFNVTYVSSSVMYQSGSNKFGNSGDDKHEFTGSVDVSGAATFSGNVGIAVTPSAWSVVTGLQVLNANISSVGGNTNNSNFGSNFYYDGTNFRYIGTSFATNLKQLNGGFEFYTAPSGTAGNAITFTQAMTLNASGNLSVGNTNDTFKLDVSGTGRFTDNLSAIFNSTSNNPYIRFDESNSAKFFIGQRAVSGDGGTGYDLYAAAGNDIRFFAGAIKALTLATTGAATFSDNIVIGTSGKGIDFSATANGSGTTSSELLNDYEEGTFTPIYTGVNLTINTYGNRAGFYTKVGRLVTVTLSIMTESVSVTGSEVVRIGGLPFTSTNTAESVSAANIFDSSRWTSLPPICGQVNVNSTQIELYSDRGATGAGTDPTTVKTGDMATGAGNRNMVRVTATYFV